jgi:hypothetical protein
MLSWALDFSVGIHPPIPVLFWRYCLLFILQVVWKGLTDYLGEFGTCLFCIVAAVEFLILMNQIVILNENREEFARRDRINRIIHGLIRALANVNQPAANDNRLL